MEFLASKKMSAICFLINVIFSIWMISNGAYLLSMMPIAMGIICLLNVLQ